MKIFDLERLAAGSGGEYVLGLKDLHTHAVYMIYGFLEPGEGERKLLPGKGHEEILCVTSGEILVEGLDKGFQLKNGESIHLREDEELYLKNTGGDRAYYVLAGGHPPEEHS